MSDFWSTYDGVERIPFGEHNGEEVYVEVKKSLTSSETKAARRRLISINIGSQNGNGSGAVDEGDAASTKVDMVSYQRELLIASIVDWNIPPRDGVAFELHPEKALRESIDRLPGAIFDELAKVVMAGNSKKGKEEARKFPVGVGQRGEERDEQASNDPEVLG